MLYHFAFATVEPDIDNTRTPSYQPCASHFSKVALALMGEGYWSVVVVLDCRLYSVQVYRRSGSLHYFQPRRPTQPRIQGRPASQPAPAMLHRLLLNCCLTHGRTGLDGASGWMILMRMIQFLNNF